MIASPQVVAGLLGQLIQHLYRQSSPELFRMFGELGLSITQVKALHLLREAGEVNVKDVASSLGMSLPAMSRALDGLVQRGLVERKESVKDRRAKLVRLLPPGQRVIGMSPTRHCRSARRRLSSPAGPRPRIGRMAYGDGADGPPRPGPRGFMSGPSGVPRTHGPRRLLPTTHARR